MRSGSRTVYLQQNYPQSQNLFPQYSSQLSQPYILNRSRTLTQNNWQKTEQHKLNNLSQNAIKLVNQQIYEVIHMEPTHAENNLRKSAKKIYQLVDNQLLYNIKHLSNMKLLLYNFMLMFIQQYSTHQMLKLENQKRQKSNSVSSSKNISTLKQQDISIQSHNNKQLQNLKQTIPFIPKDKSKLIKTSRVQMLQEQLTSKIQSTKNSLENILKKIEHYNNYRLSGEDIMRLKKSVINVSELKPSHFLNLHTLSPTQQPKSVVSMQNSRPQSKQSKKYNQNSSISRGGSRSKTLNGNSNTSSNSTTLNSRMEQDQQGNKLLIQQLQQIIERKQNRIKQLTKQLTKNLADRKQLQKTIQNFQIQINEIQSERKNFQYVIQKLQQENLNYQIQIKELKQTLILKKQAQKINISEQQNLMNYNTLKEFQTKQKICKFYIRKEIQLTVQNTVNSINESRQKDINSLSGGSPFNDISQITPKRLSKKLFLPADINQSYILQSNVITTRKNITPQKVPKDKSQNKSLTKYQMIGTRTQSKNKKQLDSCTISRQQLKQSQRQNYEKMLFLQALTIQQMLQDL